jgi:hypothetical protein
MIGIVRLRDVEIRADVLENDVRRVAPTARPAVVVWKHETFERGDKHTLQTSTVERSEREWSGIDRVDAREIDA